MEGCVWVSVLCFANIKDRYNVKNGKKRQRNEAENDKENGNKILKKTNQNIAFFGISPQISIVRLFVNQNK